MDFSIKGLLKICRCAAEPDAARTAPVEGFPGGTGAAGHVVAVLGTGERGGLRFSSLLPVLLLQP